MDLVFKILLLVFGVFLVAAVLMQHGKSHGLSGTIAGGAETFFGKDKGGRIDKLLSKMTTIFGVLFIVIAITTFVIQPDYVFSSKYQSNLDLNPYYSASENVDITDNTTDSAK